MISCYFTNQIPEKCHLGETVSDPLNYLCTSYGFQSPGVQHMTRDTPRVISKLNGFRQTWHGRKNIQIGLFCPSRYFNLQPESLRWWWNLKMKPSSKWTSQLSASMRIFGAQYYLKSLAQQESPVTNVNTNHQPYWRRDPRTSQMASSSPKMKNPSDVPHPKPLGEITSKEFVDFSW